MDYIPTIGLEIHVELKTKTKMFCDSPNKPEETTPNINVCPVCLGYPGTLPVINKEAVLAVFKVGKSLGAKLQEEAYFDRKSYFYPDLPKGYQISQYKHPLVLGGGLKGVAITRIHLEEDTGKLIHDKESGNSLIDYNRAGVPLMELVTEPVIRSGREAKNFAEELQKILRYLEVSDADMEHGLMRLEANISLSNDPQKMGVKTEVKNLNSFRSVENAIEFEIKRQTKILKEGGFILQETRGWDEIKNETFSQREKEEAHDYRYLRDPDLPVIFLKSFEENLEELPELPEEKRKRYTKNFDLKEEVIEAITGDKKISSFFEDTLEKLENKSSHNISLVANYLANDIFGFLKKENKSIAEVKISPEKFSSLIGLISEEKINSRSAKTILEEVFRTGNDPVNIATSMDLLQQSDSEEMEKLVKQIIEENQDAFNQFISGNMATLQFLIGQAMKVSKGKINPILIEKAFRNKISRE